MAGLQANTPLLQPGKKGFAGWNGLLPCKSRALHELLPRGCSPLCKRKTQACMGPNGERYDLANPDNKHIDWFPFPAYCKARSMQCAGAPTCTHCGKRIVQQQRVGKVSLVLPRKPHLQVRHSWNAFKLHGRVMLCMSLSSCWPLYSLLCCRNEGAM